MRAERHANLRGPVCAERTKRAGREVSIVVELPYEKQFHFADGTAAKDLQELKAKIESIAYDEFYRHVNAEKNDFANWVRHVLRNEALARRLNAVKSIVETVELLNEEIYPEETLAAETRLGRDDLQLRIEEQLFSELETPPEAVEEELPALESKTHEMVAVEDNTNSVPFEDEPLLPSREEIEYAGRLPGAPVTSFEPAHTPVTEKVGRPVSHEEHLSFLVKESLIGFVLGVITGLILGRVMGIIFG